VIFKKNLTLKLTKNVGLRKSYKETYDSLGY